MSETVGMNCRGNADPLSHSGILGLALTKERIACNPLTTRERPIDAPSEEKEHTLLNACSKDTGPGGVRQVKTSRLSPAARSTPVFRLLLSAFSVACGASRQEDAASATGRTEKMIMIAHSRVSKVNDRLLHPCCRFFRHSCLSVPDATLLAPLELNLRF